ncbi:hypothetical protein XA68_12406 [Ophiocordyceps unilateralis]|uniref:Uncharacterized protein n=1 Tax=Ophiocordyceps unilateralis TaxID=268505 RepID=A0A2A9PDF5_OPHUN|nr:hypothetical protein XA68_12406 [Ophiocordyceps unilateralis]
MAAPSAWAGAAAKVQFHVSLGVWTDWSRGRIMGATVTLRRTEGSLLIAFTAFFIGLVASSFWRILRLALHRYYSTPEPRDALHHQRQAILRNACTIPASLWALSRLSWTWRHDRTIWLRTLPIIAGAGLSILAFTVAGGFSSALSTAVGNAVLLDGSRCLRLPDQAPVNRFELVSPLSRYWGRSTANSANYAQQCYSANSSNMFDCTTYVKENLPGTADQQAPCPFQRGICRSDTSNLLLDTGYIDSHEHLGINSPPDDRIKFRHTTHCAPLVTAGYSTELTTQYNNYTRYYYGGFIRSEPAADWTWQVESISSQYDRQFENPFASTAPATTMTLRVIPSFVINGTTYPPLSWFDPRPELKRSDADVIIVFLSGNGVLFFEPTSDPWYRGFVPGTRFQSSNDRSWVTSYRPQEAASPLGCIRQSQFCNASGHCGPLASMMDAAAAAAPLFNCTPQQILKNSDALPGVRSQDRYLWFIAALGTAIGTFENSINTFQAMSLQSQEQAAWGQMNGLPDDQWKLDVKHWWATMLSSVQSTFISIATGQIAPELESIAAPTSQHILEMCKNQKIRTSEYMSFSLVGLLLTYVLGLFIMAASYAIEPLYELLWRLRRYKEYSFLEWSANETLQLHRAAHQGIGSGTWTGFVDAVPKTEANEVLADLTLRYAGNYGAEKMDDDSRERRSSANLADPSTANHSLSMIHPIGSVSGENQHAASVHERQVGHNSTQETSGTRVGDEAV